MERTTARRLMADWLSPLSRPDKQMTVTPAARSLLDTDSDGKITSDELINGLVRDQVSFDPRLKEILANRSKLPLDTSIRPKDQGAFGTVEQCGEFVMRYFKEARAAAGLSGASFETDFGPQHDLADTLRRMAAGTETRAGYTAYLNSGLTPPRAGDVLIAQSPDGSEFHYALITGVENKGGQWMATVYQANVPFDVNSHDPKDHLQEIPIAYRDGRWSLQRLATAQAGYGSDMDVVGWIHPGPAKALPGAAP